MKYNQIYCPHCGNGFSKEFNIENSMVKCSFCNGLFTMDTLQEQYEALSKIFDEEKQEQIANRRKNLWNSVHEENIDSVKVIECCCELKKYLPKDFQANFYEIANGKNIKAINNFLNGIDVQKNYGYIEDIVEFMIKSLDIENLLAVNNLIERAYKQTDLLLYDKLTTKFAEEAKKVDECVYDTTQPRDVFIAYSSADMDKVNELVEVLEEEGLTCFVAMRNLQHGRGAVANYDIKLQEAINNCKVVVLVSSVASRTRSDARRKELPYIKSRDIECAPAEYVNNYAQIPVQYKKPRVEYLIEKYIGAVAETFMKEFFEGNEYRYNPKEVAERIYELLSMRVDVVNSNSKIDVRVCTTCNNKVEHNCVTCPTCGCHKFIEYDENEFEIDGTYLKKYKGNKADVIVPDEVTVIWGSAFNGCQSIKSVKFPNSLEEIGIAAFQDCTNLKEIFFNDGLKYIYKSAFAQCSRLEKIALPYSLIYLGEYSFYKCGGLVSAYIPSGIIRIKQGTFCDCASLSEVDLPYGLTVIGNEAFEGCENLTKMEIPNSVVEVGHGLYDCKNLISVENGITYFGRWAVDGSEDLEEIQIRQGTIGIANNSFWCCEMADRAILPDGLKYIGNMAFENISTIKMPNSVIRVGLCADDASYPVKYEGGIGYLGNWVISCKSDVKEANIKDGTLGIANGAFYGCSKLTDIKIPKGLKSIGASAFGECNALNQIYIPDSVMNIGEWAFDQDEIKIDFEYGSSFCRFDSPQGWINGWDKDCEDYTIRKEKKISFGCKRN